jgi:hypothetical protein
MGRQTGRENPRQLICQPKERYIFVINTFSGRRTRGGDGENRSARPSRGGLYVLLSTATSICL